MANWYNVGNVKIRLIDNYPNPNIVFSDVPKVVGR